MGVSLSEEEGSKNLYNAFFKLYILFLKKVWKTFSFFLQKSKREKAAKGCEGSHFTGNLLMAARKWALISLEQGMHITIG